MHSSTPTVVFETCKSKQSLPRPLAPAFGCNGEILADGAPTGHISKVFRAWGKPSQLHHLLLRPALPLCVAKQHPSWDVSALNGTRLNALPTIHLCTCWAKATEFLNPIGKTTLHGNHLPGLGPHKLGGSSRLNAM